MTNNEAKERYAYLAKTWGYTLRQVDEASRMVFDQESTTQEEYEQRMKEYLETMYILSTSSGVIRYRKAQIDYPTIH